MNVDIQVSSSRVEIKGMDLKETFPSYVDEANEYSFNIWIHVRKNRNLIAVVHGFVLDEDKILNEHQNMIDIADIYTGDACDAISALVKSSIFKQELEDDLAILPPYTCYIETLYVYPKYRGNGVGRYLFSNLYNILLYSLNINTHCFVIIPTPQEPADNHSWKNSMDSDGNMKKTMINLLKKCGYKRIRNTEFYAINCMTKRPTLLPVI